MSISNDCKQALIDLIESLDSVKETYGHEEFAPKGWPAVFVVPTGLTGNFVDTAHNSRVYAFRITIVFPISQDMPDIPSGSNRLEYAEQIIATVLDEIINAVDTDFELLGSPALYMEAANADWGEAAIETGSVKAVQVTLSIYTEFQVQ